VNLNFIGGNNMVKNCSSLLAAILLCSVSYSQDFIIQQPALQQFGVSTTVSIPDRGSAFLGGVSSSRTSTNQYGPFRSGSSIGSGLSHSSVNTSVYIHDFQLMDKILLAEGKRRLQSSAIKTSMDPRVQHVLSGNGTAAKLDSLNRDALQSNREKALSVLRKFR